MTIAKHRLGRTLAVALFCCGVSACDDDTGDAAEDDNRVLRARAARIDALLDQCSGPGAAEASAASAAVASAANNLVTPPNLVFAGDFEMSPETKAAVRSAWNAFFAEQMRAYNAAVACGLVNPINQIDPGGWSATWDDISS